MDACEATRIVFSRIQSLDPENASKIMGLLLIQDHGEKEMIRLAFGPEALVHSVVLKARNDLGYSSNTSSTPSTPSSPAPFSNPISISRQNSSNSLSRMLNTSNLNLNLNLNHNLPHPLTLPTPSAASSSSWAPSIYSDLQTQDDLISSNSNSINGTGSDLIDEFQLQDQLSFLNDSSPTLNPTNPDLFYPQLDSSATNPSYWGSNPHRRSFSVTDVCLGSDDATGFGWKPCLYFARGYCKNGTSCRFLHNGFADSGDAPAIVGSPSNLDVVEHCQEILRSKASQQQRLAAASQILASSSCPYNKCMNFLLQQQQQNETQRAAAALMMGGDDVHKFGRTRLERSDFLSPTGGGIVNPSSRQIYLTFPADSTFREEDVSNYFSIYGPVQDVRIPYQQKRMFGFVTFVYPETVKLILAKGNPHFVCDARVLVKPYKEKGKVPDKYRKQQQQQQQQSERGDLSACTTPTGLDSRDPFDLQLGARMFYNTQDMMLRRKLEEQADLQQAMELQGRRLMGLQLLDVRKHQPHHHRNLSAGACIPSPTHSSHSLINQTTVNLPSDHSPEVQEKCGSPSTTISSSAAASYDDKQLLLQGINASKASTGNNNDNNGNGDGNGKENPNHEDNDIQESLEHNLPDSPFASPTKSAGEHPSVFSTASGEICMNSTILATSPSANNNLITSSLLPASSTLDMAPFKSCFFQMPRFSSGHGAIGM